jgi:hypothetical protein
MFILVAILKNNKLTSYISVFYEILNEVVSYDNGDADDSGAVNS